MRFVLIWEEGAHTPVSLWVISGGEVPGILVADIPGKGQIAGLTDVDLYRAAVGALDDLGWVIARVIEDGLHHHPVAREEHDGPSPRDN